MSPLALSLHFLQAQPDSRLLALARDGHEAAFEALVRRYRKELLAYCRRLAPRSGSAEDALQQTLLGAWTALNAGVEVRDARAWLYRIAHNVSLNHLRLAVAVRTEISETPDAQEIHQLVEQRLQARAALAGMASLPPLQRDVFVSTVLNGASHEEVASALGLSSGAVRGLIYRARATLRSAAAALTPSPALQWAIRRVETSGEGGRAITQAVAGGGGASVAAVIAKGGAALTLAGAVAGAGGMIVTQNGHHHRHEAGPTGAAVHARLPSSLAWVPRANDDVAVALPPGRGLNRSSLLVRQLSHQESRADREEGLEPSSGGEEHRSLRSEPGGGGSGGPGARSDGPDSGTATASRGGSEAATTPSNDGMSGGGSGGSDGGSSGSGGSLAPTSSGSDGGGPGTSSGDQMTKSATSHDAGSAPDGGSDGSAELEGGSTSTPLDSSGSGDTTTTTTTSH